MPTTQHQIDNEADLKSLMALSGKNKLYERGVSKSVSKKLEKTIQIIQRDVENLTKRIMEIENRLIRDSLKHNILSRKLKHDMDRNGE